MPFRTVSLRAFTVACSVLVPFASAAQTTEAASDAGTPTDLATDAGTQVAAPLDAGSADAQDAGDAAVDAGVAPEKTPAPSEAVTAPPVAEKKEESTDEPIENPLGPSYMLSYVNISRDPIYVEPGATAPTAQRSNSAMSLGMVQHQISIIDSSGVIWAALTSLVRASSAQLGAEQRAERRAAAEGHAVSEEYSYEVATPDPGEVDRYHFRFGHGLAGKLQAAGSDVVEDVGVPFDTVGIEYDKGFVSFDLASDFKLGIRGGVSFDVYNEIGVIPTLDLLGLISKEPATTGTIQFGHFMINGGVAASYSVTSKLGVDLEVKVDLITSIIRKISKEPSGRANWFEGPLMTLRVNYAPKPWLLGYAELSHDRGTSYQDKETRYTRYTRAGVGVALLF